MIITIWILFPKINVPIKTHIIAIIPVIKFIYFFLLFVILLFKQKSDNEEMFFSKINFLHSGHNVLIDSLIKFIS